MPDDHADKRPTHLGPAADPEGRVDYDPGLAEAELAALMHRDRQGNYQHGFIFERIATGLTKAERRRMRNLEPIKWALKHDWGIYIWTPVQEEAVFLFHQVGIPVGRCARMLGITKQTFEDRLSNAEELARRWYDAAPDERPRIREKKGRAAPRLYTPPSNSTPLDMPREITLEEMQAGSRSLVRRGLHRRTG